MTRFFRPRWEKVRSCLEAGQAYYSANVSDVYYLTGFTGDSSDLLILPDKTYFITDGRYVEQIREEAQIALEIVDVTGFEGKRTQVLQQLAGDHHLRHILLRKTDITLAFYEDLSPIWNEMNVKLENNDVLTNSRIRKDALELEIIRQNLMLTELGFHYIRRIAQPGMREREVAAELEYYLRKQGADKPSFDTIVASGARSALPHGTADDRTLEKDEVWLFDFGIRKDQYCSDFTRCHHQGKLPVKLTEAAKVVEEAVHAAEQIIRPGIHAREVDAAARGVIATAGLAEYFIHSTGHGVGVDIHEPPWINKRSETVLAPGMVFTVEPGIYYPSVGGIRLEDMVVVTTEGCEVLTRCEYEV